MSEQLAILISDKTLKVGEQEIIVSKPNWKEISVFAEIIEGFVSKYHESKNDEVFLTEILKDGAKEIRQSIEKILGLCLKKNAFLEQDKLADFLAELDYDVVFSLLFTIIEINKNFFKQNLEKVGVTATKENPQNGEK